MSEEKLSSRKSYDRSRMEEPLGKDKVVHDLIKDAARSSKLMWDVMPSLGLCTVHLGKVNHIMEILVEE